MMHELKGIVAAYEKAKLHNRKCVLATVVALEGSSYRRPGVRMLLLENGGMVGAVSGGCVEKEVLRQAQSVFKGGTAKVMTYDGRYRLGCEGILYILLERFSPSKDWLQAFEEALKTRESIVIKSYFKKTHGAEVCYGSTFYFNEKPFSLQVNVEDPSNALCYEQLIPPCQKLVLLGAEHDAVELCGFASKLGWEVIVVADPREEKNSSDFPGITDFIAVDAESYVPSIDERTAVVLMTHSLVKDLQFLLALQGERPAYLGLLGPTRRREELFNALLERVPDLDEAFLAMVHGPAGLHVGAETPQEIAIAILAEILSFQNNKNAIPLREKEGSIHSQ